ncbi:replication initiation factor domain-containing protein [Acholeplasma laidlawii]|uniref:replication initiation factor domain-containing protein n=1 Tax=Acholeplasma laidlawii TaxID=2148 RepID=UPI0021F7B4D2|nr:replication initiation factor domain-containing protein [Acholeplasma laidlawii]
MISEFLGFSEDEVSKDEFAQNRFQYQYKIGEDITLRLGGPRLNSGYKSCSLELKGEGCRSYENRNQVKTWNDLYEFLLVRLNSNVTRLDIAIDDYDGKHLNIHEIKDKLDMNLYTTSFRIKEYTLYSSVKGITLQFGSPTSTHMLVIYEKLKEQQSKGVYVPQKYWTRFEMRFYQDKAYNVIMNILKNQDSFRNYTLGLLYEMLDIKEKNNYNSESIHKAKTDLK